MQFCDNLLESVFMEDGDECGLYLFFSHFTLGCYLGMQRYEKSMDITLTLKKKYKKGGNP